MKKGILLLMTLAYALVLSACGSANSTPVNSQPAVQPSEAPAAATQAPSSGNQLSVSTSDMCSLLSQDQVEAAFGKSVLEVTPQQANIGRECEFKFDGQDTKLRLTSYEGADAQNYFAVLITAAGQSCDELLKSMFDVAFAPLTEKYPSADQSLLQLPLGDLYQKYVAALGECMYIHSQARTDVATNVLATETIFLNWSSNVAALGDEQVVEFTYQEPTPQDVSDKLAQGTDKDKFYALADPYREQVLSGYTESLIQLLRIATAK